MKEMQIDILMLVIVNIAIVIINLILTIRIFYNTKYLKEILDGREEKKVYNSGNANETLEREGDYR